ncbi:30S ribosomal protein S13 [Candidatus Gracilibacteria bacterium]|jgi:small subunit ribosomal protein S13|nr:30S ribosomal protein S13 [Candidatus Gracilibacteria bacterium]
MARIAGVNLPKEKRVEIGLTAIYGVGRNLSKQILKEAKIDINKKVEVLTEPEIASIREILVRFATEGDLKRKIAMDIKRLQEIGTYRGIRHKKGLPVRGQRTRYNCRTRKGKRKTVANKKIIAK